MFKCLKVLSLMSFITVLVACSSNHRVSGNEEGAETTQSQQSKSTRCTEVITTGSRLPSKRC